jgi:ABC-type uncharacterized transport system substrate-binding protein
MKTCLLLCILSPVLVLAHPHMFIDTELEVRLRGETLQGLLVTWHFDPMFSSAIRADFDTDRNGVFSPEETSAVYQGAFSNLQSSSYFIFVDVKGEIISPTSIEDFQVRVEDGRLVYSFYCPLNVRVGKGRFSVAVYDSSFYCDILFKEGSPVTLRGGDDATFEIVQNEHLTISYEGDVSVSRNGASYTGTAYPQQLVVKLN